MENCLKPFGGFWEKRTKERGKHRNRRNRILRFSDSILHQASRISEFCIHAIDIKPHLFYQISSQQMFKFQRSFFGEQTQEKKDLHPSSRASPRSLAWWLLQGIPLPGCGNQWVGLGPATLGVAMHDAPFSRCKWFTKQDFLCATWKSNRISIVV